MSTQLVDLDDSQLTQLLAEHGSKAALATHLSVPPTTLKETLARRGIGNTRPRKRSSVKLTHEALHAALLPPNNCRVKQFRDQLDDESRQVLDEALAYDRRDFPASKIREFLINAGCPEPDVPGVDAINAHRSGQRPCRCKG